METPVIIVIRTLDPKVLIHVQVTDKGSTLGDVLQDLKVDLQHVAGCPQWVAYQHDAAMDYGNPGGGVAPPSSLSKETALKLLAGFEDSCVYVEGSTTPLPKIQVLGDVLPLNRVDSGGARGAGWLASWGSWGLSKVWTTTTASTITQERGAPTLEFGRKTPKVSVVVCCFPHGTSTTTGAPTAEVDLHYDVEVTTLGDFGRDLRKVSPIGRRFRVFLERDPTQAVTFTSEQKTLAASGITAGTRVLLLAEDDADASPLSIFVKTLNGTTSPFQVSAHDTVKDVKEMIEDKLDVPIGKQRLIFAGKRLDDEATLDSYCVTKYCTLHLVERMIGGGGMYAKPTGRFTFSEAAAPPPQSPGVESCSTFLLVSKESRDE